MVTCCVAFECKSVHDPLKQVSFHTFPFKRPEILKLWIKAIHIDKWYPSRTSRFCSQHFVASDYQQKPGCALKLLKPHAVPTVFAFPEHLLKKPVVPCRGEGLPLEFSKKRHSFKAFWSAWTLRANEAICPHTLFLFA